MYINSLLLAQSVGVLPHFPYPSCSTELHVSFVHQFSHDFSDVSQVFVVFSNIFPTCSIVQHVPVPFIFPRC